MAENADSVPVLGLDNPQFAALAQRWGEAVDAASIWRSTGEAFPCEAECRACDHFRQSHDAKGCVLVDCDCSVQNDGSSR